MTSRGPHRRQSTPFKLQLCQDIRTAVLGRRDAQQSHNLSANLIQLWLTQFDRGDASGGTWHQALQALCAHDRQPARLSDLPNLYRNLKPGSVPGGNQQR